MSWPRCHIIYLLAPFFVLIVWITILMNSYYSGASTSCYFWSLDGDAFASCWLIKKEAGAGGRYVQGGAWDSMHVIEARPGGTNNKRINYKITTTVMVSMQVSNSKLGNCSLSGSIMREVCMHVRFCGHLHVEHRGRGSFLVADNFRMVTRTPYTVDNSCHECC